MYVLEGLQACYEEGRQSSSKRLVHTERHWWLGRSFCCYWLGTVSPVMHSERCAVSCTFSRRGNDSTKVHGDISKEGWRIQYGSEEDSLSALKQG